MGTDRVPHSGKRFILKYLTVEPSVIVLGLLLAYYDNHGSRDHEDSGFRPKILSQTYLHRTLAVLVKPKVS